MITRENIREVLLGLKPKDIEKALDGQNDQVVIEVSYSNACVWFNITNTGELTDEEIQYAEEDGQLIIEGDQLFQLFEELNLKLPIK